MKIKLLLTVILIATTLNAQTFLHYYSAGLNERGIYFYTWNGFSLFSYAYGSHQGAYQLMHIDTAGDSLYSAYMNYNNLFRISENSFLTAYTRNDTGLYDTSFVSEIDTNGLENVLFTFVDSTDPVMNMVFQTSDSLYLLAGTTWNGDTSFAKVLKADRAGHIIWEKRFLSQTMCGQDIHEIFETTVHDYMVMSYHACCCHTFEGNILVARLDTSGSTEWVYGSNEDWAGFHGQLIEDGSEFILIGTDSFTRLSSSGNVVWKRPNGNNDLIYVSLAKSTTNGFYACGLLRDQSEKAIITKFNGNGDSLYSYVYAGQHNIYGEYMQQLPDGRLACIGGQRSDTSGNGNPRQTFFLICDTNGNILSASDPTLQAEENVSVFPNPTNGNINVKFKNASSPCEIIIYNSYGGEILRRKINNTVLSNLQLNTAAGGLYFLKVNCGNESSSFTLLKN